MHHTHGYSRARPLFLKLDSLYVLVTATLDSSTGEHEVIGAHGAKKNQVAPEPEGHDYGDGNGHGHQKSKHARIFESRAKDHQVSCVCVCVSLSICVFYFGVCGGMFGRG